MTNRNRVTLSDDTIKQLEKMGKPFESVDQCIQRMLGSACSQNSTVKTEDDGIEEENT